MRGSEKGAVVTASAFSQRLSGRFRGVIRWQDLDELWLRVQAEPEGWYASLTGEAPPDARLPNAGKRWWQALFN